MIIGQLPGILWYCSHKAKKESKYFDLSLDGIVERKTFWKIMNKTLADTWQGCRKDKTQVIVEYGNYFNSFKDDDDDDLLMFELFFIFYCYDN